MKLYFQKLENYHPVTIAFSIIISFERMASSIRKMVKLSKKCMSYFNVALLYLLGIYGVIIIWMYFGKGMFYQLRLPLSLITVVSMNLHYTCSKRKKILLGLLHQLDRRVAHKKEGRASKYRQLSNHCVILILAFYTVSTTVLYMFQYADSEETLRKFGFGNNIKFEIANLSLFFLCRHIIMISYPCYVTYDLCLMLSKCDRILRHYKTLLKLFMLKQDDANIIATSKDYLMTINVLRKIKNLLNYPVLCLVLCISANLFIKMFLWLSNEYNQNLFGFLGFVESVVLTFGTFLIMCLYCDKIPNVMLQIKYNTCLFIDKSTGRNIVNKKGMELLKRVECNDIVYISAGGALHIDRKFVLTTVGGLFTYGLLLINLK